MDLPRIRREAFAMPMRPLFHLVNRDYSIISYENWAERS